MNRRISLPVLCTAALLCGGIPCTPTLAAAEDPVTQVRYAGVLREARGTGDDAIVRRFELTIYPGPGTGFFVVADDPRNGCPWPDSYGPVRTEVAGRTPRPHLVFDYDGTPTPVELPDFVFSLPPDLVVGGTWSDGHWRFQADEQTEVEGTLCWRITASESRGRRQQLVVDPATHLLQSATMDVFMGQGDRFLLTVQQSESDTIAPAAQQSLLNVQQKLLELQLALERRADSLQRDLTPRQIDTAEAALTDLITSAQSTPLADLVQRIQTDVGRQRVRVSAGHEQAGRMVGQPAPRWSLNLVNGQSIDSASHTGKTLVLHFWDYRDAPLSEPYGQTGYLEFLHNQLKSDSIRFVGISTNPEFQTTDTVPRARRSARKLIEFMNLTYPVGYDDGALLRSLGDPRNSGGQLPLWLVINAEGRIVHYYSGYYEVDPREGLRELRTHLPTP